MMKNKDVLTMISESFSPVVFKRRLLEVFSDIDKMDASQKVRFASTIASYAGVKLNYINIVNNQNSFNESSVVVGENNSGEIKNI